MRLINKYSVLLDANTPMEETFNNVYWTEIEKVLNKIKDENTKLILEKINLLFLIIYQIFNKTLNYILSELKLEF